MIRKACCFTVEEIARLFGLHVNTVRRWLKDGLEPLADEKRPILIKGAVLAEFLRNRQAAARHPPQDDEFHCFKCRGPRKAWKNAVAIVITDAAHLRIKAKCDGCGGAVHRFGSRRRLPEYRQIFDVRDVTPHTG